MPSLLGAIVSAVKAPVDDVPTGPVAGRVFREGQLDDPETVTLPYVTVLYPVTDGPALLGDGARSAMARTADAQVDVWQEVTSEAGAEIWEQVRDLLDGSRLAAYDGQMARCRVVGGGRQMEDDRQILHHVLLVRLDYVPTGA